MAAKKTNTDKKDMAPTGTEACRDTYWTLASPAQGLYKEKGSKFLAFAYPVETEGQVKSHIEALRKEYFDARHHCYAYVLGARQETYRANDDGEPSGSAGRQILGQIDSRGLSDILIVVIRYFGGIKLGIPGLIRAYRTSAADALDKAATTEKTASKRFRLTFGYMSMNGVMKMAKDLGLAPEGQDFGMECTMEVNVRLSLEKEFLKRAADIEGCTASEP